MKTKLLFLFFISSLLLSCSNNHFRKFDSLPEDHRWQASDKKSYEFDIDDEFQLYNIVFQFSHVFDYQFESVPLYITIESPDGKTEELNIDLKIKDDSGKEIGECAGDVCDLYYKIKENTKLQQGNYKITVCQRFKGPYLPNVIGIGLKVENVK